MSFSAPAVLALSAALGLAAFMAPRTGETRLLHGPAVAVGGGTASLYVEVGPHGEPRAVGIALTDAAMGGLASRMNTTSRCHDKDGDGTFAHGECLGDFQSTLSLPAEAASLGIPVRWATVNWNPEGHMHPAPPVWSAAHFDFHFFLAEQATIEGIRPGPCGEFIDCEDFKRASTPLPPRHLPDGYVDVGAAVPGMGNHLVDSRDPELADPSLGFSSTFIYGTYDGKLTFLEPMVSHAFLASHPDRCVPIRTAQAVAVGGWYPTRYCVRYDAGSTTYRVSLDGLEHRDAA